MQAVPTGRADVPEPPRRSESEDATSHSPSRKLLRERDIAATAAKDEFTIRVPLSVIRSARSYVRSVGPAALVPMFLSLLAIIFAAAAWRQVSLTSSAASSSKQIAQALKHRLMGLASEGKQTITLDVSELKQLLGAGGSLLEAEEGDGASNDDTATGGGGDSAEETDVQNGAPSADGGGETDQPSVAADAADPPGLLTEKESDTQWQGEADDSYGDGGGDELQQEEDADVAELDALIKAATDNKGRLIPSKKAVKPRKRGTRRPFKGLTRQDLVRRQLLRAELLIPRNRPDEPPRKRRAASPRAPKCNSEERFLHLLTAREGMSAWMHTLQEAIYAANALGRTFVEPCVAGGLLLPCTPGRVLPVPESLKDTDYPITADDDPLAVPAFTEHCGAAVGPDGALTHEYGVAANITPSAGRAYPLSLYLDLATLKPLAKRWSSFDDWSYCTFIDDKTGREELTDVRRSRGLVHAELAYCVSSGDGPLALAGTKDPSCVTAIGSYRFKRVWWPEGLLDLRAAGNTTREHMATGYLPVLKADVRRDLFLYNAWRGFWKKYGSFDAKKGPGFNPIHTAAVRAWLAHRLDVGGVLGRGLQAAGTGLKGIRKGAVAVKGLKKRPVDWSAYAVFQWRSETVPKELVEPCAKTLAAKAKSSLASLRTVSRVGGVLAADLPAANNPCAQWHVYEGSASESGARRRALATLGGVGLAKYDADHPGIDAGVLSIRDWLLAVNARWYVTCHSRDPGDCKLCFRSNSKYVGRIIDFRTAVGRASVTNWFKLPKDGLLAQYLGEGDAGLGDVTLTVTGGKAASASSAGAGAGKNLPVKRNKR